MICEDDKLTNTAIDNGNLRLARDLLVQLTSEDAHPTPSEIREVVAEVLAAMDAAIPPTTSINRWITPALRLEYALAYGWPKRAQLIHPTIEEPYYYWGEDSFTPTRYRTAIAALDAAIIAAGIAAEPALDDVELAPPMGRAPCDGTAGMAAGSDAHRISAAKDAEIADLRAAYQWSQAALSRQRVRNTHLQARMALLRAKPPATSLDSCHQAARVAVIRLLHGSGLTDDEIAADLSLSATEVLMLRTRDHSHAEAGAAWQRLERERIMFESTERDAELSRVDAGMAGNVGDYVDPVTQQRWIGWLRRAAACELPMPAAA